MTIEELTKYDIYDLYDMKIQIMDELGAMENDAEHAAIIQEKKEYLLLLQNALALKKLDR